MPETAPKPLITFLLVVRNEVQHVTECLQSMLNQTLDPALYEVLVIDGLSTDGTRAQVERIIAEHPERQIRLLDNPGQILSSGWNIGIREARGEYVIRPDAHAVVPRDFLAQSLAAMRDHPEAAAVGGILETRGRGFWGEIIAALLSSRIGVGGSSFRVGAAPGPKDTVVFGLYRRAALLEVGGFDEAIALNQDNVCHARLRAAGKILYFDPRIRSTYYCRASLGALWRQMFRRSQWLILMFKHQRERNFSLRYYIPLLFVVGTVSLLLAGWVVPWAWSVLGGLLALYIVAGLAAAAPTSLRPLQRLAFPLAMFVLHFSYGLGAIVGLTRLPFHNPLPQKMFPLKPTTDMHALDAPANGQRRAR